MEGHGILGIEGMVGSDIAKPGKSIGVAGIRLRTEFAILLYVGNADPEQIIAIIKNNTTLVLVQIYCLPLLIPENADVA